MRRAIRSDIPAFIKYRQQSKKARAGRLGADVPSLAKRAANPKIYFASECGKCSEMAAFVRSLKPIGLEIVAAENHPTRDLTRMTYEYDGFETDGLHALARALEHVNLGWALFGMFLRLPGLNQLMQAILDVSGGGPMRVKRCAAGQTDGPRRPVAPHCLTQKDKRPIPRS